MFGTHPYLDSFAFLGFGEQADAAQSAREAAAVLGHDHVNGRLLDAVRWGADERAQAEVARQLAVEAANLRQQQMHQQMEVARRAAAERAREAEAARRRASAEALLLLLEP
jgi:hypothetical protein